jgi:hypothetical protein
MIWLLKLLGFGKTLLSWARKALGWIGRDWRHVLIAVLSLIGAYFYFSASKWQGRAEKALAAVEARDKTIADMVAASETARLAQIAVNDKRKQDEKDNANEADKNDRIAQLEARQPAVVYRDRFRVRDICKGITFNPDSTAADPVAESGDRQGDIASMVAISSADFDQCTANSVRLQSVNRWGNALIEKGLAITVD